MKAPIDFFFDFSSPYGYLASHRIEAMASILHPDAVPAAPPGAVRQVTAPS